MLNKPKKSEKEVNTVLFAPQEKGQGLVEYALHFLGHVKTCYSRMMISFIFLVKKGKKQTKIEFAEERNIFAFSPS